MDCLLTAPGTEVAVRTSGVKLSVVGLMFRTAWEKKHPCLKSY
jgi:hypothetical protein